MTLDLSKLSPSPWAVSPNNLTENDAGYWCIPINGANYTTPAHCYGTTSRATNAAFIALARNAFDGDPEALAWWEANRRRP